VVSELEISRDRIGIAFAVAIVEEQRGVRDRPQILPGGRIEDSFPYRDADLVVVLDVSIEGETVGFEFDVIWEVPSGSPSRASCRGSSGGEV
jgi:hypothetical protein